MKEYGSVGSKPDSESKETEEEYVKGMIEAARKAMVTYYLDNEGGRFPHLKRKTDVVLREYDDGDDEYYKVFTFEAFIETAE